MDCFLCKNCCAKQNDNVNNEMITNNGEEEKKHKEEKSISINKSNNNECNIENNDRKNGAINNEMLTEGNNVNKTTNKEHNASEEQILRSPQPALCKFEKTYVIKKDTSIKPHKNKTDATIEYEEQICRICASAIDKYPSILKRMSNVELYYLCENFLARDKYNNQKRSLQETADKLISFAKGECVDVDDVKQLKSVNFQPFEQDARIEYDSLREYQGGFSDAQYRKDGNLTIPLKTLRQKEEEYMKEYKSSTKAKKLGEGGHSAIFAFNKSNILPTKHNDKSLAIAVSVHNQHELNHVAYMYEVICSKILLSLFARQTKYYTDFIMKAILAKKKMNSVTKKDMNTYDSLFEATFKNISFIERNKEIARELFFSIADRKKINKLPMCPLKGYVTDSSLVKNRMLDDNGKIIEIDLDVLESMKEESFSELWQFVVDHEESFESSEIKLSEIFSNLKKNLTISPKLIAYHALMELKKYEFKDFNDKEHANCIKDALRRYQSLLSATKDNFAEIDKDIVAICEKQLKLYDDYIAKIDEYSLKDFEKDFQEEQEQITSKINNYRSMSGNIKCKIKKSEPIPLKGCNNNVAKNQYLKEGKEINS